MIGKQELLLLTRMKASPRAASLPVPNQVIMPSLPTGELGVLLSSRTQGVHLPNKHFNVAVKLAIMA